MKIALVKQDIYQDLYVCGKNESPEKVLESTLMRVGPLALISDYNADFFIIKEQNNRECQAYKKSFNIPDDLKQQLKTLPANQISAFNFTYLSPLSSKSHKDFSLEPDQIDWIQYDIVISINISIPTDIVKKHPSVLWCYMYGEANADTAYPRFGYDAILTQNLTGEVASTPGKIDFPYTFLGTQTLERIAENLFGKIAFEEKKGIYAEINNTKERPVTAVPCLEYLSKTGHSIILHDQNVVNNLQRLYSAKYFVKLEGRKIRGNSIIEAISAGTLVLMNPADVTHAQLLPKETWIHSKQELENLIIKLDANPELYKQYLAKQRELLQFFVIDTPMESLQNALQAKRSGYTAAIPSLKTKIKTVLKYLF